MTRLTLFIDPGRIKRGVRPLEEVGPALEEGKSFTLAIDANWRDANGQALKSDAEKRFRVGAPDRKTPDPARWKISPPRSGRRQELKVDFDESLDYALALRVIRVTDASGRLIPGKTVLSHREQHWSFAPANAWRPGQYQLLVQTTIEDLAGNNIGKPFDVDLFEAPERRFANTSVTVLFSVR